MPSTTPLKKSVQDGGDGLLHVLRGHLSDELEDRLHEARRDLDMKATPLPAHLQRMRPQHLPDARLLSHLNAMDPRPIQYVHILIYLFTHIYIYICTDNYI